MLCVSLDYLCRWLFQVSVYCTWRIPAHLRCTQCSILLHLMYICFLTCICLWQISQIQTCLFKVVGPGLVSTSPAFVRSSASHPVGTCMPKNSKSGPHCWGREGLTQFAQQLESTACRLCSLEPMHPGTQVHYVRRRGCAGGVREWLRERCWKLVDRLFRICTGGEMNN